jgi:hypothetical protein
MERSASHWVVAVVVLAGVVSCGGSIEGGVGSGDGGGVTDGGSGAGDGGGGGGDAGGMGGDAGGMGGDGAATEGGTAGQDAQTDSGSATGVLAVPANDFLDSIGVCTHIAQGEDSPTESATALAYAGIRGIRDDGNPDTVPDWITVHQQSGVRLSLLTNHDVASTISMAKQLQAAGALLAVEGPNEPNNFPVTYGGQTSANNGSFLPVANLQHDLYEAVKAEPALAGIPVFHSSEAGGSEPDNVGLQFLTIPAGAGTLMPDLTKYADYANTHNYICGHQGRLIDNLCWSATDPTLNDDWDGLYVEYGHTWNGHFQGYSNAELETLPRVTTETGWVTSGDGAITEEQQGRLFLNLYLAGFKRGWSYTFIYMLKDSQRGQGIWGFFDTSYNPKKSGTYLHNFTTILADSTSGTPGRLDYSIPSQPATVHDLLLQKSNGAFELVVWNERPSGGSNDVTVNLGGTFATVNIYDPTTGTAPTQTLTNISSVALTLTDHPVIIEL